MAAPERLAGGAPRAWLRLLPLTAVTAWLLALIALSGSPALVLPPLVLVVIELQLLLGLRWSVPALLLAWLAAYLWLGFQPLQAYLALATAAVLASLQGLGAARRQAAADLALTDACLAAIRGVAATRGAWDPEAAPDAGRAASLPPGLALWRIAPAGPELLTGTVAPAGAEQLEELVRQAAASGEGAAARLTTPAGPRHVLAMPVPGRAALGAALTVVRQQPLRARERSMLADFARTLSPVLANLDEVWSGQLVLDVVRNEPEGAGDVTIERRSLQRLLDETGLRSGAVLRYRDGRFVAAAIAGSLPHPLRERLERGIGYGDSALWRVRREGRPLYLEDCAAGASEVDDFADLGARALALVPVGRESSGEAAMVALFHDRPRAWPERERALLSSLAAVLQTALARRDTEQRLSELVRLQAELLATPIATMYQRVLEAAKRMVAPAEAGSLLVRGDDGRFRYVAAVGFALEGLTTFRLDIDAMRTWYGQHRQGWETGEPRVLVSSDERTVGDVSALTTPREWMRDAGRVDEIVADLCLPILYRDEVLAVLNLDAMHDPQAFGEAARRASADLAPVIGFLLHETEARARLDRVARTDELTGLGNRRAFNEQASRELARAGRHGHELTLLVMDLSQFKELNDRLGHTRGDDALRAVAEALKNSLRAGDTAFRWGGDEFAALLPHAAAADARAIAERVARAVASHSPPGENLRANLGAASLPSDGRDLDTLLTCADDRMYRAKAAGSFWYDGGEGA